MNSWETVALPHGYWIEGKRYAAIELRAVDARDDAFLLENIDWLPAVRANALLARCVRPSGESRLPPGDLVRSLVAGDLEAVLLHLHRLTFGNEFVGEFRCISAKCGELLDLALRVDALLLPDYPESSESYDRPIHANNSIYDVRFRLPNGADLEQAAPFAHRYPDDAGKRLLQLCVQKIWGPEGALEAAELDDFVVDRIAEAMQELDPQAVTEFQLTCPACHCSYTAEFHAADFLLRKLDQRIDRVLREIHALALCYHWSEEAILGMPPSRRQKYLEMISSGVGAAV